ncbi:MAG: phosphoribosylpyrophosphate synthetase [Saprospiraceae bacterium]
MVEALSDLAVRGYVHDFNLIEDGIHCKALNTNFNTEEFEVKEFYRFEGETNPDDSSILYAVVTHNGEKGVIVDGYGVSSELSTKMVEKLKFNH